MVEPRAGSFCVFAWSCKPPQADTRDIRMWQCLFSDLNIGVAYGFIDIPYFTSIKEFVRMALDTKKRNKN